MHESEVKKIISVISLKDVVCLRCGVCCITHIVEDVPGYDKEGIECESGKGLKPNSFACKHLVMAYVDDNNVWHEATCTIRGTKDHPPACGKYIVAFNYSFCAFGILNWKKRKSDKPNSVFPEIVEKSIEEYDKCNKNG